MKKPLPTLLLALALAAAVPATAAAAPPAILSTGVSGATTKSIVLEAQINPKGKATKYHFEYGPADCASNPCESTPEVQIPAGEAAVPATATVGGLTPGATYHFRAVAGHKEEAPAAVVSADRLFSPYLPPQVFGGCPNEAIRTENQAAARIEGSSAMLPDCRAWEQVTPVDKGAGDASDQVPFARAAADGDAFSFLSVSGVPGGVGSQELPAYLARRGEGGWSTEGMLPPATSGQKARVLGWDTDLSDVFTEATRLDAGESTALLDGTVLGTPQAVAPYVHRLEPRFVGATSGADEVFFESKVAIPRVVGALEGRPNVYVWTRATGELRLADSLNDETAPSLGAHAGSYDWVHGTTPATLAAGGAEAHYYTADQHAFAADGSALYFTEAGTGRLYVRLNPAAPQSPLDGSGRCTVAADACTVAVSATQRTAPGPDPAGAAPAAFQASADNGKTSFFTSSEMLTDNANTGPEQEPPAVVSSDLEGHGRAQCVPTHAQAVAVDSEHVYWIDLRTGAIGRANIDCVANTIEPDFLTAAELEIKPGLAANPRGLAVQGGFLYWAAAAGEEGEGAIGRAKLNGTGAASGVEPDLIPDAGNPQGVATDSGKVYWTDSSTSDTDEAFIGKANLDGTEAEPELVDVGRASLAGIAVDAGHIYWVRTLKGITPIPGRISRAKLDGSEYTTIYIGIDDNTPNVQGLAVEGNHIYWTAENFDEIGRATLNGEGAASDEQPGFIPHAGNPRGLATDASHIYWTAHAEAAPNPGNDLYRHDADTGTLTDLAPDHTDPDGAEVRGVLGTSEDGSYVYFVANGVLDGGTGSPNGRGESAETGDCAEEPSSSTRASCNLYLWHEGNVSFIARLEVGGVGFQTDATNWFPASAGVFSTDIEKTARVSADGKALLFRSQHKLTAYENGGSPEFYLYRRGAGVSCVSCNPTGEAPTRQPRLGSVSTPLLEPGRPASTLSRNLSVDGNRVFLETTDPLVVEDTNGESGCPSAGSGQQGYSACADTYEWETPGTGSCTAARAVADGGCVYLLSTGKGSAPALIGDASAEGEDVFFFSRSRLVGQDEDSLEDVYDAREDGGLASQNPAPPKPPCEGEGCKPGATPAPAGVQPATPSFVGPSNPKPRGCQKGKVARGGRCVAKHPKHKHKRHDRQGRHRSPGERGS